MAAARATAQPSWGHGLVWRQGHAQDRSTAVGHSQNPPKNCFRQSNKSSTRWFQTPPQLAGKRAESFHLKLGGRLNLTATLPTRSLGSPAPARARAFPWEYLRPSESQRAYRHTFNVRVIVWSPRVSLIKGVGGNTSLPFPLALGTISSPILQPHAPTWARECFRGVAPTLGVTGRWLGLAG